MEQHANTAAIVIAIDNIDNIENNEPEIVLNNVIVFPRSPDMIEVPLNLIEAQAMISQTRRLLAEEVADEATEMVMSVFKSYNYFTRGDIALKDLVALNEVMKAVLMRHHGIDHQFHQIIDEAITLTHVSDLNEYPQEE